MDWMLLLIVAVALVAAPVYLCILVVAATLGKHVTLFAVMRAMQRNTEQSDNEES